MGNIPLHREHKTKTHNKNIIPLLPVLKVNIFKAWENIRLKQIGRDWDMTVPWGQLAPLLRSLYVNVRKKNGELYKLSALKNIRFGLRWEDTKWRYVKSYRPWRYGIACMHVYFLIGVNETTPCMSPRVGMTFSGHPGLRFSLRGIGNLSI
jgi:hypothetical protein